MNYKNLLFILLCYVYSHPLHAKTVASPEHQVNLVEVYSSQGCSSCPPAEKWLSQFKNSSQLFTSFIPINFHVDYWDYLGWKDPYSDHRFTKRQRAYNTLGHTSNVATPGFIIKGKGWNGWFRGKKLPINNKKKVGQLTVEFNQIEADINFNSIKKAPKKGRAHIAILAFDQVTYVSHGENSGKMLPHDFVVIGYQSVQAAIENNRVTAKLGIPNTESNNSKKKMIVVWVSEYDDPSPIQVVGDWL